MIITMRCYFMTSLVYFFYQKRIFFLLSNLKRKKQPYFHIRQEYLIFLKLPLLQLKATHPICLYLEYQHLIYETNLLHQWREYLPLYLNIEHYPIFHFAPLLNNIVSKVCVIIFKSTSTLLFFTYHKSYSVLFLYSSKLVVCL